MYKCPECENTEFYNQYDDNYYCPQCCTYFTITFHGTIKKYKQMNNLKKILLNYTGSSLIKIDKEVKKLLENELKDKDYSNELYNKCKKILIKNKLKKQINQINIIYFLINRKPVLDISYDDQEKIMRMFLKIFSIFNKMKSKYGRKNFIKMDFILGKVLESMNIDNKILRPLKRKSTKELYNKIWDEIILAF